MKLPIFYRPEQSCTAAASYSPSAAKPALVMADWLGNDQLAPHLEVHSFEPATDADLCAAHDPGYVAGILSGDIENGFDNTSLAIANSLRYTVGSMLAAAKHVLSQRGTHHANYAISPTSGFHHAGHSWGGGYCTFNGLMVTAIRLHQLGLAKKILIIDMDQHYGNGTQDIIDTLGINCVHHITAQKSYKTADEALHAAHVLHNLDECYYDLVLYQAGADIHLDDPLGGLLTTHQMSVRDRTVFTDAIMRKTPLVWNLAGGYQRDAQGTIAPVLKLHRNTLHECLKLQSDTYAQP